MICADAICVYLLMMKCALQFALENPVVILVLTIIISFTVTSSDVISPLDVTYQCIRNISYIFEKKNYHPQSTTTWHKSLTYSKIRSRQRVLERFVADMLK